MIPSLTTLPHHALPPLARPERRREHRHSLEREQTVRILVYPSLTPVEAGVCNVSARGIGLLLVRPVEVGSVVALLSHEIVPDEPRALSARVVHSTRRHNGDWLIGCLFSCPLSGEEVQRLVE